MEANLCDINHLDSNILLPPRKRLLAGLKKQNIDGNTRQPSASSSLSEFDIRLNELLRSNLDNSNLSPEEIAEASRSAAAAAVKVAEAARAAAEEKAEIAAKAIAAARSALELVAAVSEPAASKEGSKKNGMKKHLTVRMLYDNHRPIEKSKTDEEMARRLHQAMNSSPRISKNSPTSEVKSNKHKRLKGLSTLRKTRLPNGGIASGGNPPSMSKVNGVIGQVDSEGSIHKAYNGRVDKNTSNFNKVVRLKMDNEDAGTSHSKEIFVESLDDKCSIGRKRGRIKQKKLPLSICTFRDRANPKVELTSKCSPLTEEITGKTTSNDMPLSSLEPSDGVTPVGTTSMWKCKALKAPMCVKQSNVMQS